MQSNITSSWKLIRDKYPTATKFVYCVDNDSKKEIDRQRTLLINDEAASRIGNGSMVIAKEGYDFNDMLVKLDMPYEDIKRYVLDNMNEVLSSGVPDLFRKVGEDVYFIDTNGHKEKEIWVAGGDLRVSNIIKNSKTRKITYRVNFIARNGEEVSTILTPDQVMKKYSSNILSELGGNVSARYMGKELLSEYINQYKAPYVVGTDLLGWANDTFDAFVFPDNIYNRNNDEKFEFIKTEGVTLPDIETKGTLSEWKTNIGNKLTGNPVIQSAVLFSFVPAILDIIGRKGFWVDYSGRSSSGKTSTLHIAASVTGSEKYVTKFKDTIAFAVADAVNHNCFITLKDDTSNRDHSYDHKLSNLIFSISEGEGKGRLDSRANQKEVKRFKTIAMTTGNLPLKDICASASKGVEKSGGLDVRILGINCENEVVIDHERHTFLASKRYIESLVKNSSKYYGTPIIKWIEWLVQNVDIVQKGWEDHIDSTDEKYEEYSAQDRRKIDNVELIRFVGKLLISIGVLDWDASEVDKCADYIIKKVVQEDTYGTGTEEGEEFINDVNLRLGNHRYEIDVISRKNPSVDINELIWAPVFVKKFDDGTYEMSGDRPRLYKTFESSRADIESKSESYAFISYNVFNNFVKRKMEISKESAKFYLKQAGLLVWENCSLYIGKREVMGDSSGKYIRGMVVKTIL